MNILFINPPAVKNKKFMRLIDCSHEAKGDYLWQPNDFMIISSYLSSLDNAILIDGTADELSNEDFMEEILNTKNKNIDVIFFATGSSCYLEDLKHFEKIREIFYEKTICVLGDIFLEKNFRKEIISKGADAIIFQPFNLEFNELISLREKIINKKEISLQSVITDPETHPFFSKQKKLSMVANGIPRHELFKKKYSWPFLTTKNFTTLTTMWGCTYSCSYCPDGVMHPYSRTNEVIIDEIKHIKKLGFKEIQLFDKVFGVPKEERIQLLKHLIKNNLTLPFSCYFHPSMYDPEFLELMKKAKCHTIIIGIDTADLKSLAIYRRKVSEKTLSKLIEHANILKINICADFIIGLPHENEKDIRNTIAYSKKIDIDFASFNIATALPGSSFRRDAIAQGKMKESHLDETLHTKFSSSSLSAEKLIELRRGANFTFYFRPKMILRRLLRLKSIEHFFIQFSQMVGIISNNWK
jgi:anaerobic magnesium-protoporphyrin IX monomethyl ester cyclase